MHYTTQMGGIPDQGNMTFFQTRQREMYGIYGFMAPVPWDTLLSQRDHKELLIQQDNIGWNVFQSPSVLYVPKGKLIIDLIY